MKQTGVICTMEKNISYKESVKEAIMIALVQLMDKKEFNKITIQEIVDRAGVGRSSFYRNYYSKEDVLADYISSLFDATKYKANPYTTKTMRPYIIYQFRTIKKNHRFFQSLQKNNLLYLLYDQAALNARQNIDTFGLYHDSYQAVFCSNGATGVIIEWIRRDFRESEEELTDLFIDLVRIQPPET